MATEPVTGSHTDTAAFLRVFVGVPVIIRSINLHIRRSYACYFIDECIRIFNDYFVVKVNVTGGLLDMRSDLYYSFHHNYYGHFRIRLICYR